MRTTDERSPEDNERRVERMNTWIELAEATQRDHMRFVLLDLRVGTSILLDAGRSTGRQVMRHAPGISNFTLLT